MTMIRAHLMITGEVQGVFYRASARDEALNWGLVGWVRNQPDGSVEALVEGPETAVDGFIKWCWRGPQAATVVDVQIEKEPGRNEFDAFSILR